MVHFKLSIIVLFTSGILLISCTSDSIEPIVDLNLGYEWPNNQREYWPTDGWRIGDLSSHGMNLEKMNLAIQFAQNDPLSRAVLVVKDGYLVSENYFEDGGVNKSSNLWSVTKSFSSAMVGLLLDNGTIVSTSQMMADLMPTYPEFNDISLHHVLTQTTGLDWDEEGPRWVDWILSDDWVAHALAREYIHTPGSKWKYSSGNSHFLTSLVGHKLNESVGAFAKEQFFDPMGIPFETLNEHIEYSSWDEYLTPMYQTWRKDTKGIETASFGLYLTARDMAKFGFLYLNRGKWDSENLISENWVIQSTKEHVKNIYGRYSYGYQWFITLINGKPAFLASGFGGQIIGVVPSLDLIVVLKYEAENPVHPKSGTSHDDMHLFELVVEAVN
jgi:CubicO group peptidase (beta-lactamase class C family)